MDRKARQRMDAVLAANHPTKLVGLKTEKFADRLADMYAELDFIHPFAEGNSRTLRTFSRQLAEAAGFDLPWHRFGASPAGRDLVYVARDISVNTLARKGATRPDTLRAIVHSLDTLHGNRSLQDLVRGAMRPARAVAFAELSEIEALGLHPELGEAYATLRAAASYFAVKLSHDSQMQRQALESVASHVLAMLDEGETTGFAKQRRESGKSLVAERENGPPKDATAPREKS
jgi:cell filamentation protein